MNEYTQCLHSVNTCRSACSLIQPSVLFNFWGVGDINRRLSGNYVQLLVMFDFEVKSIGCYMTSYGCLNRTVSLAVVGTTATDRWRRKRRWRRAKRRRRGKQK